MALRFQSKGGQTPWKLEELKAGLEAFHKNYGHYPTGPEVDRYGYLPSARSVERRFGGMVALRKKLSLGGQDDYRTGTHSSERARTIGKRAHVIEREVYDFLWKRFGRELVHREYFFTDESVLFSCSPVCRNLSIIIRWLGALEFKDSIDGSTYW